MSQVKVLVVDDNHDLADGLGMILEEEGYDVTLAYNGTDAVHASGMENFDIAFLDVKLPDMNGVEVFCKIRKKNPAVKVLMMTGYRVEELLAEVIDNGSVEILRKPFKIKYALEVLDRVKKESIVLIADDDPDFADGLSEYLTDHGLKTMLAHNGQEAVDGVLSNPVDVLVLDLRMPVMNGMQTYLELKQQGRAVKTIIITGYSAEESETIDVLQSTSVTGCLFKPFKPEELLKAIKRIVSDQKSVEQEKMQV